MRTYEARLILCGESLKIQRSCFTELDDDEPRADDDTSYCFWYNQRNTWYAFKLKVFYVRTAVVLYLRTRTFVIFIFIFVVSEKNGSQAHLACAAVPGIIRNKQ